MIDEKKVVDMSAIDGNVANFRGDKSFVKITAKATFNDMNSIKSTIENFNEFGKALAHVTNFQEINTVKEQLENAKKTTQDKSQKNILQAKFNEISNINKLAKASGLQLNQKYLDDIALVLSYGFQDQLEIQMNHKDSIIISANLNRDFLRENMELVIRKYSRRTKVDFTLFGIITQFQQEEIEDIKEKEDFNSIKEALMNLVSSLTNIESSFTGRLNNEIIIDPIALYTEL